MCLALFFMFGLQTNGFDVICGFEGGSSESEKRKKTFVVEKLDKSFSVYSGLRKEEENSFQKSKQKC